MIKTLRIIFWDQLSLSISSLANSNTAQDIVLMSETLEECTYVKHHKKKIAFLLSAMRHFAESLSEQNYQIEYSKLDDKLNTQTLQGEVARTISKHKIKKIIVTQPSETRLIEQINQWEKLFNVTVEILPDNRFLCSPYEFKQWAGDRKQLRMEYFYREMRKRYNILMQANTPIGDKWNFDSDNRKPAKSKLSIPKPYHNAPDEITNTVLALVSKQFSEHFGNLSPFYFAVTREQALQALKNFIQQRLPLFGDHQDAMLENEPWMYHSHLSFYLNCGLLLPLECVREAEKAYHKGHAPLNAVEGFVRQIIGWREYIRGIYWLKMPSYLDENYFNAHRALPEFYWTAKTDMNCLKQCIKETQQNAYAHHIQRLMVLGNFALLTGIEPKQVNEWFHIVYADAYQWVELPNVSGMVLFADGGYLASKPYAAGGSYINKMSDYCKNCRFKVSQKTGEDACPFNYLYWDFLARNRKKLQTNPRISMMYKTYDRFTDEKKKTIADDSKVLKDNL